MSPFGAASPPLRLLVWLRLKLALRGIATSKMKAAGLILMLLLVAPAALGIAAGAFFALWQLPLGHGVAAGEKILLVGLSLIAFLWVLSPMMGFALNDAYDITRLFLYPISKQRLFLGALLGSLADTSTLLLVPTFLASGVALFLHGPAPGAVACLALPLFLIQTLALSQGVVLATQGILRSRRFRDIALVVVPLFWMTYQFVNQAFFRAMEGDGWKQAVSSRVWGAFAVFPSGMAARAIGAADRGETGAVLLWLALLAAVTVLTIRIAGWMVGKAYGGEEVGFGNAPPQAARTAAPSPAAPGRLPPTVAAIARKEWLTFRRDPYFRVLLMNLVYSVGFAGFMVFNRTRRGAAVELFPLASDLVLFGGAGLILLQQSILLYNQFGIDGRAAARLFSFPASRREILLGKNLAYAAAAIPLDLLLSLLLSLIAKRPAALAFLVPLTLLSTGLLMAVGNVYSTVFPYRIEMKGFRARQTSQGTFLQSLLSLAAFCAAGVLLLPIVAAMLAPRLWIPPVWIALTLPLATAYTAGLYLLSLRLGEAMLREREPALVERLTRADEG